MNELLNICRDCGDVIEASPDGLCDECGEAELSWPGSTEEWRLFVWSLGGLGLLLVATTALVAVAA